MPMIKVSHAKPGQNMTVTPSRIDRVIRILPALSFLVAIVLTSSAVGFWQGAVFVAEEAAARFDCVERTK